MHLLFAWYGYAGDSCHKLTLPLLVLRLELIDNVNTPLATDDDIIWTYFLYAGTHFHADHLLNSD